MEALGSRFTAAEGGARLAAIAGVKNILSPQPVALLPLTALFENKYRIQGVLSEGYQRSVYVTRESRVKCTAYELSLMSGLKVAQAISYEEVEDWRTELEEKQVVVCTYRVLRQILEEGILSIPDLNVLIIDSCHLVFRDEDLRYIMKLYRDHDDDNRPRILALTYPLFSNKKPKTDVNRNIQNIDTEKTENLIKDQISDEKSAENTKNALNDTDESNLEVKSSLETKKNSITDIIPNVDSKDTANQIETKTEVKNLNASAFKENNDNNTKTADKIKSNTNNNSNKQNSTLLEVKGNNLSDNKEEINVKNSSECVTKEDKDSEIISDKSMKENLDITKDTSSFMDIDKTNLNSTKNITELDKIYENTSKEESSNKIEENAVIDNDEFSEEINSNNNIENTIIDDDLTPKEKQLTDINECVIDKKSEIGCDIGVVENLDDFDMYEKIEWKIDEMERVLCCQMDMAEDIDIGKRLSAPSRPKELIVEHKVKAPDDQLSDDYRDLETYMRDTIEEVNRFLYDHRYDPTEIYGVDLYEEFKNIPDPTIEPKYIIKQFLYVLDHLGPYAADKAAFSLLTKLEKQKIKVPYERHFLLLCLCTSVFVKIRCYAELMFSKYENDWEKIANFSTPKLLRFSEMLELFRPMEHNFENKERTVDESLIADKKDDKFTEDSDINKDSKVSSKENRLDALNKCDFLSLSNKIEDQVHIIEGNLKEIPDLDSPSKDTNINGNNLENIKNNDNSSDVIENNQSKDESKDVKTNVTDTDDKDLSVKSSPDPKLIEKDQELSKDDIKLSNEVLNPSKEDSKLSNQEELKLLNQDLISSKESQLLHKDASPKEDTKSLNEGKLSKDDTKLPNPTMDPRQLLGPKRPAHRNRGRGRNARTNAIKQQLMAQNSDSLCGIVFMKEPLMAKILFLLVVDMSRSNPKLSYICAQYCAIEKQADPTTEPKECRRQANCQEDVLKKFRMHECNLLLTTSVLEEGIDLPRCNLVLRWDEPPSYLSAWACRERARAARASCVMLSAAVGNCTDSLCDRVAIYKQLDQIVTKKCGCGIQNEPPSSEEDHADLFTSIIQPYTPQDGGSRIKQELIITAPSSENSVKQIKDAVVTPSGKLVNQDTLSTTSISDNDKHFTYTNSDVNSANTIKSSESQPAIGNEIAVTDNFVCNKCGKIRKSVDIECDCVASAKNVDNNRIIKLDTGISEDVASVDLNTAIALINRYCGKLPSDTFTRLAPQWWTEEVTFPDSDRPAYICTLRLPVNCPVSYNIVGHPMPTRVLARRMVALQACRILHKSGELDDQLMPIGKENFKATDVEAAESGTNSNAPFGAEARDASDIARPGTTKRRQYYYKRTARAFTDCQPIIDSTDAEIEANPHLEGSINVTQNSLKGEKRNMLYAIVSRLCCALPERYNTRGRRLHTPQHASQALAILMARGQPDNLQIPAFPVYTRSGEVKVSVEYVPDADVRMSPRRGRLVRRFMRFVFDEVLRVRRKGMKLQSEGSTHNNYYIVPTVKSIKPDGSTKIDIDWKFLEEIYQHTEEKKLLDSEKTNLWTSEERDSNSGDNGKEREKSKKIMNNPLLKPGDVFHFDSEKYKEAVVTPWYRNQDQPQFFLVAEICWNLSPDSAFPSASHASFREYYSSKYGVTLTQANQPLLDVDHTSARLNLLTPRYVNRKGVALPVSSERTRLAKRDRLDQKQILVAELCRVHPFPSPLWFATTALPAVLYRINALLIADEIRRAVALEVGLGVPKIDHTTCPGFNWPALDFGWSLAEVLNADSEKNEKKKDGESVENKPDTGQPDETKDQKGTEDEGVQEGREKTINDILQEKENAESGFEIGMWSNDMASSIPESVEYDEFMEPLPPNLTFCTSASGGTNWCEPVEKPKSHFNPSKAFSVADSDCSYMSSDFDTDDSDFNSNESDDETDTSGFCSSKNSNVAMGVRIEYKTAHEAEAVDIETKKTIAAPLPDEEDDLKDREVLKEFVRDGIPPKEYVEKFHKAVSEHRDEILQKGLLIKKDEPILNILPEPIKSASEKKLDVDSKKAKMYSTIISDGLNIEKNKLVTNQHESIALIDSIETRLLKTKTIELDFEKSNSDTKKIDNSLNLAKEFKNLNISKEKLTSKCIDTSKLSNNTIQRLELNIDKINSNMKEVNEKLFKEMFPYKDIAASAQTAKICLEEIEKNKRILLKELKDNLPENEVKKLNCFAMKDVNIDAKDYVNEKIMNIGFDTKEKYEEKIKNMTKPREFNPYYMEGKRGNGFDFDYQPDLQGHPGPSPSIILQALTMSNANDGINLERLETIGDSFLKFAITAYLYCAQPNVHEGKLSHMRSKQVSNLNLYRLGRNKRLGSRMIASKFEPHDNWLPPCYRPPSAIHTKLNESQDQNPEAAVDSSGCFIPYNLITQHSIPDKSIADCVEALIGAYLVECGYRGALLFMSWLGIKVLPKHEVVVPPPRESRDRIALGKTKKPSPQNENYSDSSDSDTDYISDEQEDSQDELEEDGVEFDWRYRPVGSLRPVRQADGRWTMTVFGSLRAPPSPLLRHVADPEGELQKMLAGYEELEATLHYRFVDRSLLLQAVTHASHSRNTLTDCYQRLEFLGDAILDYLITRHLYEDARRHSPGALTDLRSALVNNTIFATLAARHGFHKYFRHLSPGLNEVLTKYVKIQEENGHSISEEHYLIQEDAMEQAEDVEVPKALGDLFESIAGAIFLDSGMSLGAVWSSYEKLMGAELEAFSAAAPKSPVRELLEAEPDTAKFGKPERLADGRRVRVCVEVFGRGCFKGVGRNYRIAKGTAARCALRHLRTHRK